MSFFSRAPHTCVPDFPRSRVASKPLALLGAALALVALGAPGCKDRGGSDDQAEDDTSGGEEPVLSSMDERVRCESLAPVSRGIDVNNDARPDLQEHAVGGVMVCVEIDLNFDGRVDVTRFYGPDGVAIEREEHDYDFDGRLDEIAYYADGVIRRKELDTTFDHRVDTWMWCDNGVVTRAQRDRHNRGRPDVWETYVDGLLTEARYDDNADGHIEKWEIFRDGSLVEVRFDNNGDEVPDRTDAIHPDDAGPPEERLRCEVTGAVTAAETAASTPDPDAGATDGDAETEPADERFPADPSEDADPSEAADPSDAEEEAP